MNVEDILGYAQIKANKFNKVIKKFNIKTAINEINDIQRYKADSQNIQMITSFTGFPKKQDGQLLNYIIEGDAMRIK